MYQILSKRWKSRTITVSMAALIGAAAPLLGLMNGCSNEPVLILECPDAGAGGGGGNGGAGGDYALCKK